MNPGRRTASEIPNTESGTHHKGVPGGTLIQHSEDGCKRCWGCVRHCPTNALGVTSEGAVLVAEKCVACGACVVECANGGHVVRDDTPLVRALLESGGPVVAMLATEATAALHPRSLEQVESELEAIGFYAVESTLLGEEMVAADYERLLSSGMSTPRLRSTCPVTVEWVRRFHPRLVSALSPLVPPYVAQAKLVKRLYPAGTAVVYVSPCYARKDEYRDEQFAEAVDAVIDFTELADMLDETRPTLPARRSGVHRPGPVKEVSLTDGFPRRAISGRDMTDSDVVVVRGLREIEALLQAITRGESAPGMVDMLCCDGCLDGPAVASGMSIFAKRNVVAAERDALAANGVGCRRLLPYLPQLDLRRSFTAEPVIRVVPTAEEVDRVLLEGEFASRAETIDCGACGRDTCVDHAIAIIEGTSTWEMCWPLQTRRLERSLAELEHAATTDPVTGLWNRRVFEARLTEETERVLRYGSRLSLIMLDLDGFKAVNDTHGHQAGDAVLAEVGRILKGTLRATDLPARYGGDEFGVLLPGIGKTEAFAVAEKLREAIATIVPVPEPGAARVTASIGVATCMNGTRDAAVLLEAADRALYHAKERGRDRVGLAPD